jgi:hypothetical protein
MNLKHLLIGITFPFLIGIGLIGGTAACSSCTPTEQQQVVNAISPGAACVSNIVQVLEGTEDVSAIISECGVFAADVYQIVSELLANDPTSPALDASATPTVKQAHLMRIRDAAKTLMDAGVK